MTLIAVREAPPITCPSWCKVPGSDHVEELPNTEGVVIHWSESEYVGHAEGSQQTEVRITRLTYVDGVRNHDDGPADLVYLNDTPLTTDQALELAASLINAVARTYSA